MEAVAGAEVGVDEGFAGQRVPELCAEPADGDVDGPLLLAERPRPDDRVELLAADDPAASARKRGEQAELPDGQRDRPAVGEREELAGPDLQPALLQDFVRRCFHRERDVPRKGRKIRYGNVTFL